MSGASEPRQRDVSALTPALERELRNDFELVRRIVSGSDQAWHEFLSRYSGLICSVIDRYLHSHDYDDRRTVYVDVIHHLYRAKLGTFEGRSTLATWIVLVTRNETLDFLRRRFGRHEVPPGIKRLRPMDREIYRLYYVQGLPLDQVRHNLGQMKISITVDGLVAALRRIEERLTDRTLRRLSYDLHAQSVGAASGRLLEFLDHVRTEFERRPEAHTPEYILTEKEARRTAEAVRNAIARLPPGERTALQLRYEKGWSARKIAEELGLASPRAAYTLLDGLVRKIRAVLGGTTPG